MPPIRFTRMGSSNVVFQAHVSEDSRFVLVPVMEKASVITGWLVYDSVEGALITDDDDKPFEQQHQAREYVISEYYSQARAS